MKYLIQTQQTKAKKLITKTLNTVFEKLKENKGNHQTDWIVGVLITIGLFGIIYLIFKDAINGVIKDGLNNAFTEMFNTFK